MLEVSRLKLAFKRQTSKTYNLELIFSIHGSDHTVDTWISPDPNTTLEESLSRVIPEVISDVQKDYPAAEYKYYRRKTPVGYILDRL